MLNRTTVIIASALIVLGLTASGSNAAKGPTYTPKFCMKPRVEPGKIVIACGDGNAWIKVKRYSFYNRREAGGKGKFFGNTCEPDCARGSFVKYPVKFRLTKPRRDRCGGRKVRYFHIVKIKWKGERPPQITGSRSKYPLWCAP